MEYTKPWLSIDEQIDKLRDRGARVHDRDQAAELLRTIGYYRLTGYLYPFRESEHVHDDGRARIRVLNRYRPGTTVEDAARFIEFDRVLRLIVLEGVERIELALRTQIGYVLGRFSAFAHEDPAIFTPTFTETRTDSVRTSMPSRHQEWTQHVSERQNSSDEAFVAHFRDKYDNRMPIWALIEILEFGQVSRLYAGLRNDIATEIAHAFKVPTKKLTTSWIASVNYVRNLAAHHARLFNRKLVAAPKRPRHEQTPLLAHLTRDDAPKQFGTYSALAVMAYLLRSITPDGDWAPRLAMHLRSFPKHPPVGIESMGMLETWLDEDLWTS